MLLVRLLIAFVLAVALPLQGFAATTCLCKSKEAGIQTPSHTQSASKTRGDTEFAMAQPDKPGIGSHGANHPKANHGGCATCALSCCLAAAPAEDLSAFGTALVPGQALQHWPLTFVSWAEPVPHEPPRS